MLTQKYDKGFYVYAEKKKFKTLKDGIEYVTRYCGRAPIRKQNFNYDGKNVTFSYNDHKDDSYREVTVSAEKFILLIICHLITEQFKIIRYYGFYRKKPEFYDTIKLLISKEKRAFRKTLLKHGLSVLKSFNRVPYQCPKCNTKLNYAYTVT